MGDYELLCEQSIDVSPRMYVDIAEQVSNSYVYIEVYQDLDPSRVRFMLRWHHIEDDDTIRETRDELIALLREFDPSARIWGVDPSTQELYLL